jgi:hypothetical protein
MTQSRQEGGGQTARNLDAAWGRVRYRVATKHIVSLENRPSFFILKKGDVVRRCGRRATQVYRTLRGCPWRRIHSAINTRSSVPIIISTANAIIIGRRLA